MKKNGSSIANKLLTDRILELRNVKSTGDDQKDDLIVENLRLKDENERLKKNQYFEPTLLIVRESKKEVRIRFTDTKGNSKEGTILKKSSQYTVLWYLVKNIGTYIPANELKNVLKPSRAHAEYTDWKGRLDDVIDELQVKFGKEIIFISRTGYVLGTIVIKK